MWHDCTGRGVRVAVVDSGIHASHPHVGGIAGGTCIGDGAGSGDLADRIGHGTAVAAAIREKAPDAALYAVKVFDRTLATTADTVVHAIRWAADAGAHVVNLSLGTRRADHALRLAEAVEYARALGTVVVAAGESDGTRWLPGCLPGVISVHLDWRCPREEYRVVTTPSGARLVASGLPRPIPGVPVAANLKGVSFAVANMSGFVARLRESRPQASADEVVAALCAARSSEIAHVCSIT
jgi:hypothetical protein